MKDTYLKIINIFLIILLLLVIPIPRYRVRTPGRGMLINEAYEYETNKENGIFVPYVSTRNANLAYIINSLFNDTYEIYRYKDNFFRDDDYNISSELGKNMVNASYYDALIWLHELHNLDYTLKDESILVSHVYEESNFDLQVGDVVSKVNGFTVRNSQEIKDILDGLDSESNIVIKVIRDDEEVTIPGNLFYSEDSERYLIGFVPLNDRTLVTDLSFEKNDLTRKSGSSGGLATALSMYYTFNERDVFMNVFATGEITEFGDVIMVGGIKHKLIGADKKADLFIVPEENLEEALEVKSKFNLKTEVVGVSTIKQAITEIDKRMK